MIGTPGFVVLRRKNCVECLFIRGVGRTLFDRFFESFGSTEKGVSVGIDGVKDLCGIFYMGGAPVYALDPSVTQRLATKLPTTPHYGFYQDLSLETLHVVGAITEAES